MHTTVDGFSIYDKNVLTHSFGEHFCHFWLPLLSEILTHPLIFSDEKPFAPALKHLERFHSGGGQNWVHPCVVDAFARWMHQRF